MNKLTKRPETQVIASIDKIVLNHNSLYFLWLLKYFRLKPPLLDFSFNKKFLPKEVHGFKRSKFRELYTDKDLKKSPELKFKARYQWLYEDKKGRSFHFKWRFPNHPMVSIAFEFFPTIEHGFDYNLITSILSIFNLDYRDFHVSSMEYAWDFYGDKFKNIKKNIWSKAQGVRFGFENEDGKKVVSSDPEDIPRGACFTRSGFISCCK